VTLGRKGFDPCRLLADSVERAENAAKAKFSQKLTGGRFLLKMDSSCEEGR
jgi:hypothetical protein